METKSHVNHLCQWKQIYICIKELGFIVFNGTFTEYQEKPIHFKKINK